MPQHTIQNAYPEAVRNKALSIYKAGKTVQETADIMKVSAYAVREWARKSGVLRPRGWQNTPGRANPRDYAPKQKTNGHDLSSAVDSLIPQDFDDAVRGIVKERIEARIKTAVDQGLRDALEALK